MNSWCSRALLAGALLLPASVVSAVTFGADGRLQVSNLAEFQVGRDPTAFDETEDRSRFFDQLIVDWFQDDLHLGFRAERYQDSVNSTREYEEITQKYAELSFRGGSIRVGNSYVILGRGLLFRAFELPGVVRQVRFPTGSFAESRDLDGVVARWGHGPVDAVLLSGTPTVNREELPGGDPPRREGSVYGGHGSVAMGRGVTLGAGYLQVDNEEDRSSADLSVHLNSLVPGLDDSPVDVSFYGEYAGVNWQPTQGGFDTHTGTPHALYSSTEIAWPGGGVSLETKDYHDFDLAVNDPPSLVPEFSEKLLNRATHFLEAVDEKGLQVSASQSVPAPGLDWVVDVTHAASSGRRKFGEGDFRMRNEYELTYLSLATDPYREWQAAVHGAVDRDEFDLIDRRRTVGLRVSGPVIDDYGFEVDVAHQRTERKAFPEGTDAHDDFAAALIVSRAGWGQVGLELERSNDPFVEDDPTTPEIETDTRRWLSLVVSADLGPRHQLVVFAGQRRGGPACVSGTCYVVPDFEGAEMRLISRF